MIEANAIIFALEAKNIAAFIKNEYGQSLAGEVPFLEVLPEIWILEESNMSAAKKIYQQTQANFDIQPDKRWKCQFCSEWNEQSFEVCWKCQSVNSTD